MRWCTVVFPMLLPIVVLPIAAMDWSSLKREGYVNDYAGVIDATSKAELEQYAANVERVDGVRLSFVTLDSLQGEPLDEVSDELLRGCLRESHGDSCVELVLAPREHRSRFAAYGLFPGGALDEESEEAILLAMQPELAAGHDGPAFVVAADRIGGRIGAAKHTHVEPIPAPRHDHARMLPWILVAAAALLVGMLAWSLRRTPPTGLGFGKGGFGGYSAA